MMSFEISKLNNVTVVPIPMQALPSHESNDCLPPPWYATHMPQNKTTNSNRNRATATTTLAPSTRLSATPVLHNYWWNSCGYCSSTPSQKNCTETHRKGWIQKRQIRTWRYRRGERAQGSSTENCHCQTTEWGLPCHRDDGAFR